MVRKAMTFALLVSLLTLLPLPLRSFPSIQDHVLETFPDAKAVDAEIDALMTRFLIPGAGLALIKDGQIIYTKGYGYSNVAKKQYVTDESTFGIGSITKSFTALAIMQLVEVGKVDLDAPVTRYLPEFRLADEVYTPLLQVRHLLTHSSGLPRADEQWAGTVPASRAQVIADMAKIKPTAKPGEVWQYCNQNFALLGAIIEKVSGMTYEAYLQKNVFVPLGMSSANLTIEELFQSTNPALPYNNDVLNDFALIPVTTTGYQSVKMLSAAGAINANVKDMAVYALMQLGKGKQLVSPKSLELMHSRQITLTGIREGDQIAAASFTSDIGYGFAWLTESYRGKTLVGHGGGIDGYISYLTLAPEEGAAVMIVTNTSAASHAFTEAVRLSMIERLLGLTPTKDLGTQIATRQMLDLDGYAKHVAQAKAYHFTKAELEKYNGNYDGAAGQFSITAQDGKLLFKSASAGTSDAELIPFEPGKFLINGTLNTVVEFKADADGLAVLMAGSEVGRRSDSKVIPTIYTDPKGHFSVPVITGLTVVPKGDLTVITPKDGSFVVTLGTLDMETDQDMAIAKLAANQTPAITTKPDDTRRIPVNRLDWTQYLYQQANQSLFVVEALTRDKTVYFITMTGTESALGKATPVLNAMLLGFKLN